MKNSILRTFVLATTLALLLGLKSHAGAETMSDAPTATKDSAADGRAGTPGTTVNSTTNTASDETDEIDNFINKTRASIKANSNLKLDSSEDTNVALAFFLFLTCVILGGKYIASRNEQRRLEVLKMMLEKQQPVPENVVNQILSSPLSSKFSNGNRSFKQIRNAYAFTLAGVILVGYAIRNHSWGSSEMPIVGLVFLCLGVGGLAGLYLHKEEKVSEQK